MIIHSLGEVLGTGREVRGPGWTSRRLLLAEDRAGFSMNDTVLPAGAELELWYANHVEAVYVLEGRGEVADHETGEVHRLEPGVLYLAAHERHTLRAHTQFRAVCVFTPPLTGGEVHDENGAFPLPSEPDR
ncbi:ectoine synthase [Amycolatopsis australiensis]|uniref:L-ectoine synthase n=1 Tax=Amycolatopsis australiensis TaxID=546364 RepID=A0A1K1SIC3_9PSEU|nr:ectoine synthase [Amycolatopsis australiensis]SFW84097.1 ectoine synthase [Amycolatopsis australiensis]